MEIAKTNFGNTDFHILISKNKTDKFLKTIKNIKDKNIFFKKTEDVLRNTLLHKACYHNNFEIVSLLIKFGHELNCQNIYGQTPLHIAYMNNFIYLIDLLLESGSNTNIEDKNNLKPAEARL